jgi:predicted PurR-regulated permease PerM
MIPQSLRSAWLNRDREEPIEDEPEATGPQPHDVVLRYATVGILVILMTAGLHLAKTIAMPIVGGLIFGLVLGPLVDRMMRARVPQGVAAAALVLTGVLVLAVVVAIFAAPFALWSDKLPGIVAALRDRFADVGDLVKRIQGMTSGLTESATPSNVPRVVAVDESSSPLVDIAISSTAAAGGMLIFIATIYFYLATRRHLKARALRLCLGGSARRSAGAFFERIETKIASYFGVVTIINLGMGLVTAIIAWAAGLPFPLFWGLVATILNYIAFVGPTIMTALLFGAGLLDENAGWMAAAPAFAYFVCHLIEGNIITPIFVGRRLTLSPFLVFVSFVFWLWLWGPVGAILSTPILLVISLSIEAVGEYRKLEAQEAPAAVAADLAAPEGDLADQAASVAAATQLAGVDDDPVSSARLVRSDG